jgi:type IV secretory pathway VirD2 relaxase
VLPHRPGPGGGRPAETPAEQRGPGERMRRFVIKARIVRLKRGGKGADANLRYLQRDGTDREGERGRLY